MPTLPPWGRAGVALAGATFLALSLASCSGDEGDAGAAGSTTLPTTPPETQPSLDPALGSHQVAFITDVAQGTAVVVRPLDTTQPPRTVLLGEGVEAESLTWSPDGTTLFFVATPPDEPGENYEIWSLVDGEDAPTRLTNDPGSDGGIAISPDGSQIAFFSNRGSATTAGFDLWIMGADGSDPRELVDAELPVGGITFTPDGSTVLYAQRDLSTSTIWAVPAAGGTPTAIATAAGVQDDPAVSPDGTQVAFTGRLGDDTHSRLYLVGLDGSAPTPVTAGEVDDRLPRWSPDGSTLAFIRRGVDEDGNPADVLFVRDLGSGEELLISSAGGAIARQHQWSPDGRFLLFTSNQAADDEIAVVAADGSAGVFASSNPSAPDTSGAWWPLGGREVPEGAALPTTTVPDLPDPELP